MCFVFRFTSEKRNTQEKYRSRRATKTPILPRAWYSAPSLSKLQVGDRAEAIVPAREARLGK